MTINSPIPSIKYSLPTKLNKLKKNKMDPNNQGQAKAPQQAPPPSLANPQVIQHPHPAYNPNGPLPGVRQIGDKGEALVCEINKWNQIRAIMSKELVRFKRKKCSTIVILALACVFAVFSSGATIISFVAISFLSTLIGAGVIQNNVEDRILNFRGTFKLMGLLDEAYITGNFLF